MKGAAMDKAIYDFINSPNTFDFIIRRTDYLDSFENDKNIMVSQTLKGRYDLCYTDISYLPEIQQILGTSFISSTSILLGIQDTLHPLGVMVVDKLRGNFSFVEYEFTRMMEQALDDIAAGKADYRAVISEAHTRLEQELQTFAKATGKFCPKCGKPMVRRVKKPGRDGKGGYDFWGCTGWPECKEVATKNK